MIAIPLRPIAACMGKWKPADSAAQGAVTGAGLQVPDRLTISPLDEPTVRRTHRETMRIMLLAAAAGLSLAASTAAYADGGDGPAANTLFTELPGVVAQADVPNASTYAQNRQALGTRQAHWCAMADPKLRHAARRDQL
jgi:hypothetical protein